MTFHRLAALALAGAALVAAPAAHGAKPKLYRAGDAGPLSCERTLVAGRSCPMSV